MSRAGPLLLACWVAVGGGCSLVYDPEAFDVSDAAPLPPPDRGVTDAAPPPDGDPSRLVVTSVEPSNVLEGEGSAATGRMIPIVVTGSDIAQSASISIVAMTDSGMDAGAVDAGPGIAEIEVGETVVSADGTMAATTIAVQVMPGLGEASQLDLHVVVTQAGFSASVPFVVHGLDELTLSVDVDTDTTTLGTFSRIVVDSDVHFSGDAPARLHATENIVISAVLDVDGVASVAGAGGCAGGPGQTEGACGVGGGGEAVSGILTSGPGGGGGGYGGIGAPGTGGTPSAPAGSGGTATGTETLVPFSTTEGQPGNRGNGGGGGGAGLLGGSSGGAGGGGAGAIEIRAGGTIEITAPGAVRARGGGGSAGTTGGGGGGGGAGGAILLRAGFSIANAGGGMVVTAPGGDGGTRGGNGSVGRVRVDGPTLPDALVGSPSALRGPAWRTDLATIVQSESIAATLTGGPGRTFAVWVGSTDSGTATLDGSGTQTVNLTLMPGRNDVCAFVTETADFSAEASTCRTIVYLPSQ